MLFVGESPGKGRGVFAKYSISKGKILEECEVIFLPADEESILEQTILKNYLFQWGDGRMSVVLGTGSLYNHSYKPNAQYFMNDETGIVTFEALRDIEEGEEITVNYNGAPHVTDKVWFDK